mmetsp:Transcript_10357/g.25250  ORF Transcript_10357/g.25250 Transcript_10357/m.25250 type:complete len:150 (+) Transcript_10357:185-634(+)|eukprot:CAMPEP_0114137044 /NCGR_PEP_ID=MMETSP0043_2-20121206/15567_1 /TAXON_ID=464988 /ORGANISM="Hemiselmis andersenii, Strain CCMP644" /LENGTH=149 /DNA_ID=CAMNT_0001230897 /DNA_START=158 /DNA_END=607 /DNA_ORIENTATION=-
MKGYEVGGSAAGEKSPTIAPTLRRWSGGGQGAPPVEKVERIWSDIVESPASSPSSLPSPSMAPQPLSLSTAALPQGQAGISGAVGGGRFLGEDIFKSLGRLSGSAHSPGAAGKGWIYRWGSTGSIGWGSTGSTGSDPAEGRIVGGDVQS